MGFFSHAAMLGVGYWIGKSYCFRYKVHELTNEPNASEVVLRVERNERFWPGHWHHHHCRYEKQTEMKKNPEVLEVETK